MATLKAAYVALGSDQVTVESFQVSGVLTSEREKSVRDNRKQRYQKQIQEQFRISLCTPEWWSPVVKLLETIPPTGFLSNIG